MATVTENKGKVAFPRNPAFQVGKKFRTVPADFTFPGTGANGDQYVLAGPLTLGDRVHRIIGLLPALTSSTDANLGFYKKNADGTYSVAKASGGNELWSGVSLATAVTALTDVLNTKNTGIDRTKNIGQILGLNPDQSPGGVYLILTLPTANTAGGNGYVDVIIEEATTN